MSSASISLQWPETRALPATTPYNGYMDTEIIGAT